MTVITFAKHGSFSSAFGGHATIRRHSWSAPAREGRVVALAAAALSVVAAISIFALGIQTTILTLALADHTARITRMEEEAEVLRIEALKISNPQYITDRARMLELVSGSDARYVTLGMPEEFALTNETQP